MIWAIREKGANSLFGGIHKAAVANNLSFIMIMIMVIITQINNI